GLWGGGWAGGARGVGRAHARSALHPRARPDRRPARLREDAGAAPLALWRAHRLELPGAGAQAIEALPNLSAYGKSSILSAMSRVEPPDGARQRKRRRLRVLASLTMNEACYDPWLQGPCPQWAGVPRLGPHGDCRHGLRISRGKVRPVP